jgi:flagella basal body P-ring formation protein FlgA
MIRILLPALLIAMPAMAAAATLQDTATLDRAVAGFTGRAIGEDGGARTAIDSRLKLGQCPTVALSWHGVRHDAVMITCSGPDWHIYVPLQMAAPAPFVPAPAAAAAVAPPAKPVIVIKRGDPVMVEAADSGFSISREAVAMGDAAVGQRFMCKGDGDKAPFQAVAVDTGRATLPGWQPGVE